MSVTKVPSNRPAKAGAVATAQEGLLEGMSVTVAAPPPPKTTVKAQIASKFRGVKNLFRSLGKRAESASIDPQGPARLPHPPLPRLPDGSVNVEAMFEQASHVRRLKRIADDFGKAESQAVKFLVMTQQLPELDSPFAAQIFVDAVRSEFTSGNSEQWLHTGNSDVPEIDARLRAIKEKAQSPGAEPHELKAEINALVDPLKAAQVQLVTTTLLPALLAECH
ncbi:MAG: hypothetical protein ACAI34_21300 [Verrucomicrobium sp.]|nr:hypothetical protein [Verrucomicrobium sp.]